MLGNIEFLLDTCDKSVIGLVDEFLLLGFGRLHLSHHLDGQGLETFLGGKPGPELFDQPIHEYHLLLRFLAFVLVEVYFRVHIFDLAAKL